jgi:hypothetical protein
MTWMVTSYKKCSYHNVHIQTVLSDVPFFNLLNFFLY